MKKKIVLLLCAATMACMSFTACGSESNEPATEEAGEENTMGDPEKETEDVNEEDTIGENEELNAETVPVEESEAGDAAEEIAPEDAATEAEEETEAAQDAAEDAQLNAEENAEVAE